MKEFLRLIRPIIKKENFIKQKNFIHHGNINVYQHVIKVAYISYKKALKSKKKLDINSIVIGALLHDYYLYDWHIKEKWHRLHGLKHPKIAYKNALKDYPEYMNKKIKDIILHHMFPLTIIPPLSKEARIVSNSDKKATYTDYKKKKTIAHQ